MTERKQNPPTLGAALSDRLPPTLACASVVIVDDQTANIALLTRLLRSVGLTNVHAVTDSREAVTRCMDLNADLVLLDLQMPHMDGFEVMSALREALPADAFVPVLVLTADVAGPTRDRALSAGAKDFVTKPFEPTEVLLRVRNLLETRALHVDVQRHNTALRADLAARAEGERRHAYEQERRNARIDQALAGDAFSMVFQPIAELAEGRMVGVEALARFHREPIRPPDVWFAEAAMVGRAAELELAAVEAALAHVPELPADAFIAVNVSAATAVLPELSLVLERASARQVVLELTEHTRIDDYDLVLERLGPLRRRGVRIAVDDAGAGYAGLQHVLSLAPDVLKLDIDLTRSIDADPARRALATAMVSFGRDIDAVVIAEGVETAAELATLRSLAIPCAQGYYLARPGQLPLSGPCPPVVLNGGG